MINVGPNRQVCNGCGEMFPTRPTKLDYLGSDPKAVYVGDIDPMDPKCKPCTTPRKPLFGGKVVLIKERRSNGYRGV